MAVKKKAVKRPKARFSKGGSVIASASGYNWIPFCVQIEHAEGKSVDPVLSITAYKFPNSVYFIYQQKDGPFAPLNLPLGIFRGYMTGMGTFNPQMDALGISEVLTLDPSCAPTAHGQPAHWDHGGRGGGGIIIQP